MSMIKNWDAWKKYRAIPCTRCNDDGEFMDYGGNLTKCPCKDLDDRLEKESRNETKKID